MRCAIHVGAANATHAGPDSCDIASTVMLQVATIPPTANHPTPLCSYLSPEGQPVYMCTQATINEVPYYWDHNPPGTGSWVMDKATAHCEEAISQEIFPGPAGPILDLIFGIVDPLVCPILAGLPNVPGVLETDAEGDVFIGGNWVYDCPPYGT